MKIKMYSSIISINLNGEEDQEIFAIMFDDVEQLDKYLNGTKPLKSHRLCDNLNVQPGYRPDLALEIEKYCKAISRVCMPANASCGGKIPWNDSFFPFIVNKSLISGMDIDQNKGEITEEQRRIARFKNNDVDGRPASEGCIGDLDGDGSYAVEDGSWSLFDDRSDDDFESYVLNH